ncbi:MAG: fibronectin type III domain-containing protein [Eubacterium sp.]|nr:fibronectin type III domain-containing protein [Eubacterium sp.]
MRTGIILSLKIFPTRQTRSPKRLTKFTATGYEIQYSTDKKFKNKKTTKIKSVAKNSKTSITINKLKAGKRYYVRVRSYKKTTVGKKTEKLYGTWSSAKSVKAKNSDIRISI